MQWPTVADNASMKRIEFVCGIGYGKDGVALDNLEQRLSDCRGALSLHYQAFTELDGQGYWAGVAEPVKVFVVFAEVDLIHALGVAQKLACALNQECVAVAANEVNFKLVRGAK